MNESSGGSDKMHQGQGAETDKRFGFDVGFIQK
jgi:hypothetical protein